MSRISSTLPMTPIVDTGVFVPSPWTWPDGTVRLLAVRTPTTCAWETFALASFAGSSVIGDLLLVAAADVDARDALDGEERGLDLGLDDACGLAQAVGGRRRDRRDDAPARR